MDERVKFYEKGNNHTTFFTKDGIYLSFNSKLITQNSKLTFLGANKDPEIISEGLEQGRVNYFFGNDPEKWKANIPTYKAVVYKEIYPGIDMKFYGNNHQLEYDIIIKPGADPSMVKLSYEGIKGLKVTEEEDLEITLKSETRNPKLKTQTRSPRRSLTSIRR